MDKDGTYPENPFPRATLAARTFWKTPVTEELPGSMRGRNLGYVLELELPYVFEDLQREFGADGFTFSESLPTSLRRLAKAMRALMEGTLQLNDKVEIALISKLGQDFIGEAVEYFEQDKKDDEAIYGLNLIQGVVYEENLENLEYSRGRSKTMEGLATGFAQVVRQLDLDLQPTPTPPAAPAPSA